METSRSRTSSGPPATCASSAGWGGLGLCTGICSLVEDEGTLLVARTGRRDFSKDELDLLRGMGRVLALSLRSIRLIGELRERQTLLERLTLLQRSIASRADIEDVLDAIVTGASELLGDELVDLSLIDPEDPTILEVVASVGYAPELLAQIRRTPVEIGIAGHAVTGRRPSSSRTTAPIPGGCPTSWWTACGL